MIRWSFFFFLLSIFAAVVGFGGFDFYYSELARQLFFVLFGICLVTFFISLTFYDEIRQNRR